MYDLPPGSSRPLGLIGLSYIGNRVRDFDPYSFTGSWPSFLTKKKRKKKMGYENRVQSVGKTIIKAYTKKSVPKGIVRGQIKYQDQWWNKITWNSNQQTSFELFHVGTRSQWLTTTNGGEDNRDIYSYQSWFNLNPLQGIAAGGAIAANPTPAADRMVATSITTYIDLMNTANLPCFVKLHVFLCKGDTEEGPLFDYAAGVTADALYSTNYSFPASAGGRSGNNGNVGAFWTDRTNTIVANLTSPPYHNIHGNTNVKGQWKKLKTVSLTLAAADNHRLTILIPDFNQSANRATVLDSISNFPKGSICVVLEGQGALALDSTATTGTLGLSPGEISYAITRRVNLATMKSPNQRFKTEFYANPEMSGGAGVALAKTLTQGAISTVSGAVLT